MHAPHPSSDPPPFHKSAAPSQANNHNNRHDDDFGQCPPGKRNSPTDTSTTASPPSSFHDSTQSSRSAFTKLRTHSIPPLHNASSSTESPLDTWLHIERYLFATYTALQSGDEATLRPLKAPQSRMAWYAAVFNLCHGDPNVSRDLYAKLALAVLHTLEMLVLYPMLRHADRGRLHIITGRDDAPSAREAQGTAGAASTTRPVSNLSFSFMRRLLFGGDPPAPTVGSTPTSRRGEPHAPPSSPAVRFDDAPGVVPPPQLRTSPLSATVSPVTSTAAAESKGGTDAAVLTPGGGADTGRVQLDDEEQLLPEWSVTPSVLLTQPSSTATAGVPQSRGTTEVMEGGIAEALSPHELHSPTPALVSASPAAAAGLPSSFCRTLMEEYANFMSFRRVVISCFSYLDQYYTRRFGMDTVSMMCLKIFYVVVYEPIRPLLLDEIIRLSLHLRTEHQRTGQYPSREGQLLQDTLGIIGELVAQVQATLSYLVAGDPNEPAASPIPRSLWRPAATPTGSLALPRQGSGHGSCVEANALWDSVPGTLTKSPLKLDSVGRGGGVSSEAAEPSDMSRSVSHLGRSGEPSAGLEREASKAFTTPVPMRPTMAAHPPPLVVDLRRIIEVSERLTSRSLAASMAQQALEHSEIKSRADSQTTVQTGSIVVEVTQTLAALVMTDVGDAYVAAAEEYYAHEVSRHLSTPWGRRHYVHWVRDVFQVERHLTQQLKFPSFQSALRTMLVRRLLTDVNRTIILDPDSGFLALLEVWSGSRQDDGLLHAVLEGTPPSAVAPSLPTTTGAAPVSVKPLPPDVALGFFFAAFAETQDEACLLLLGSVLAAKVIQDCAQLVTSYLKTVICGTTEGGPAEPRRRLAGVSDPVDCVASPSLSAGRELMQQLLGVAAAHEALIMNHLHADAVLLNALRDALAEVLNPTRWSRPGAQTSSEQRVREGVVPHSDLPSVLLSRDAGAKATAPLVALAASIPDGTEVALHDLINDFYDINCLQDGATTTSVAAGGGSRASAAMVDLESVLSQVATFASLLDNKDVFVEGFRVRLARRLIARHAEVSDVERSMVRRLQLQLGVGRTHAFELMFRDCDGTIQTREGFRETDAARRLGVDVRVQLLSSSHWPVYRMLSFQPHPSLAQGMDALQEYYMRQHPSRALQWIHLLSSASLRAEYPLGTKAVLASSVQATILLHVSEASNGVCRTKASANGPSATSSTLAGEHLSATPTALLWRGPGLHGATPVEPSDASHRRIYLSEEEELPSPASWPRGSITGAELAARMGMEFSALQPHLASVVRHKVFALVARLPSASPTHAVEAVAEEEESPLHATNRFVLNAAFTHRAQRIRLPLPRSRLDAEKSGDASSAVPATVLHARHQQLDAAIIRIMKSSRLLRYHDLRVMATQQVSGVFMPSTKVIKSRVEHLLSWGYLKRSDDDAAVLEYLA